MGISGTDWAATPCRGTKTDRQDKQDNQDKQENRDNQNNDKKATQRPTTIVDICSVALGRIFLPFVICALPAAPCRGGHEQATLRTMTPTSGTKHLMGAQPKQSRQRPRHRGEQQQREHTEERERERERTETTQNATPTQTTKPKTKTKTPRHRDSRGNQDKQDNRDNQAHRR
jgi:hypothetical protein